MKRFNLALLAPAALALFSGCYFYSGGDDDDCIAGDIALPAFSLRNPQSGQCEDASGGGGGGCGPTDGFRDPGALPDWAQCFGGCEGLDEQSCTLSDGCRAIYTAQEACGPDGTCTWVQSYADCWGTAPSGPIQGPGCEALDAYSCSLHNDCSAVHDTFGFGGVGGFNHCVTEGSTCGGGGVPWPGASLRNPETGKCENIGGGDCGSPPPPEGGADAPIAMPDWATCDSFCTGLDETTCRSADGCRAIYANACPPWADCFSLQYTECWGTAPTGPIRGGECAGLDSYTCSLHDDCVAEHDSDWSGCNMGGACDWTVGNFLACNNESTPPPACATLPDEDSCIARMDCTPIYEGSDCMCDANGNCTCTTWTYVTCT